VSNALTPKKAYCVRIDGQCETDAPFDDPSPRGYYDYIESIVDTLLARSPQATWTVSARRETPEGITVRVHVDSIMACAHPASNHVKIQILLVEDSLRFDASNHVRIWRMVPRAIAGDSATGFGFPIATSGHGMSATTIATTFDLAQVNQALKEKNRRVLAQVPLNGGEQISEHFLAPDVMTVDSTRLGVIAMIVDDTTGDVIETRYQRVMNDVARRVSAGEPLHGGQP